MLSLLTYFFIDKLFGNRISAHLLEFRVNYFSYVLLNMAFFSYLGTGMTSFHTQIRQEQIQGTLESILLAPVKIPVFLLSLAMWNLIFASLNVLIYILLGIFLFKIDFSNINFISAIVILLLSIATFSGLGIISASFVMIFKRGNPLGWMINALEGLLGGVYFPVSVMPRFLQVLAKFLPITYGIRAMQFAVYKGASVSELKIEICCLILFALILLPLGLFFFRYALKKARRQGSLSQY